MDARKVLVGAALVLGVTETVDIPHTGVPAAVFAFLFFACGAWVWRRASLVATAVLAAQCFLEVSQAHTWKGVSTAAQDFVMALGSLGLVGAAGVFVRERSRLARPWRSVKSRVSKSAPAAR